MSERIRINVTQRDIDYGVGTLAACPVARALRRHRGLEDALVEPRTIHVKGREISMPFAVERFVYNFDHYPRHQLKPMRFTLDLPEEEQG